MKKDNLFIIFIAGVIAALVALLFAPKSGEELREDLKEKAKDTKDSVQKGTGHLVEDFKTSYFEAVDEVEKELDNLSDKQEKLRDTISSIEDELTT